jgi:hypothetical protein
LKRREDVEIEDLLKVRDELEADNERLRSLDVGQLAGLLNEWLRAKDLMEAFANGEISEKIYGIDDLQRRTNAALSRRVEGGR